MVPKLTFLINHEKWYIGITNQVISNLKWEKYFSPSQEQVQQEGALW